MIVSTYRIDKNLAAKKVNILVGEQMTLQETERFARDFQNTVASIDAGSFELHIDGTDMKVLTQDLADKLTQAMQLYKQAGFKKIVIVISNNPVLKMQVSRVMRQAGLTNAEVVAK